jgi:hypothetical protein
MQVGDDACNRIMARSRSEDKLKEKRVLSSEQKARMQAGRKVAKEKAREGLIDSEIKTKKVKTIVSIIGYGFYGDDVLPIFSSEKGMYNGKIFATAQLAKESRK